MFAPGTSESLRTAFEAGQTFEQFLPTAEKNADLWQQHWERAVIPEAFLARVAALPERKLLVLSADWCGDAANSVPVIARLAERAPTLNFRVLERDEHPALRDSHLTNGRSQSIPVVMVLDERFVERGWWGPRPSALQEWVMTEGMAMEPEERYKRVRRWYAQDRGTTTLDEVIGAIEASV